MEARSKRIRKRPGSEINGLKEDPVYETTVRRLELDGKPISAPQKWLRVIKVSFRVSITSIFREIHYIPCLSIQASYWIPCNATMSSQQL